MGNYFGLRTRIFLCWIAALGLQGLASAAFAMTTECAATPAAAVRTVGTASPDVPVAEGEGYRVTSVRWDPVLRDSWATIASCGHPEWPEFSLRVGETDHASHSLSTQVRQERSATVPVVHAGDIVQLWRQEDLLRLEVVGVAEESGSVGETIRVRLVHRNDSNQAAEEQFTGVVRGRADVEMQP